MTHTCIACNKVLSSRSAYTQHLRTKRHETRVLLYNATNDEPFVPLSGVAGRPYLSDAKAAPADSKTVDDTVPELESDADDTVQELDIIELLDILQSANKALDPSSHNHQVSKRLVMKCNTLLSDIQRNLYTLLLGY